MQKCAECGAVLSFGQTCSDHFHLMLFWELDYQLWDVHHLMVLCFNLQHPSLLSMEGLVGSKQLLLGFLEQGVSPQEMLNRISKSVDSGARTYKIKGTPESYGGYTKAIQWEMRACDVVQGGIEVYYANVHRWADATLKALRKSDNLE